jgi:multifunctional methyltransferase subunit TRM112
LIIGSLVIRLNFIFKFAQILIIVISLYFAKEIIPLNLPTCDPVIGQFLPFSAIIMRLLTHNSLRCVAKEATLGYPLLINIDEMDVVEVKYNRDFIIHLIPSLNWEGLKLASSAIGLSEFPDSFNDNLLSDEEFLRAMHNLLLEIEIRKGTLTCPDTKKTFLIDNGIPNMK